MKTITELNDMMLHLNHMLSLGYISILNEYEYDDFKHLACDFPKYSKHLKSMWKNIESYQKTNDAKFANNIKKLIVKMGMDTYIDFPN